MDRMTPSGDDPGPSRPFQLVGLEPSTSLRGISAEGAPYRGSTGQVTGGGLAALIDARLGLQALWMGDSSLLGGWEVRVGHSIASPVPGFRWGEGRWSGEYATTAKPTISESAVLLDDPPVLVLQWSHGSSLSEPHVGPRQNPSSTPLHIRFLDLGGSAVAEIELQCSRQRPATCCLVCAGIDPIEAVARIRSLRPRESRRVRRSGGDEPLLRIQIDGEAAAGLDAAQRVLGDAELHHRPTEVVPGRFLGGFSGRAPHYLTGSPLLELGVGALAGGRPILARRILDAAAFDETTPPTPLLYLAARHALSTGQPESLAPLFDRLVEAAGEAASYSASGAFPSAADTVRLLIRSLEPIGRHPSIRLLEDRLEGMAEGETRPSRPGGRALPVVRAPEPSVPYTVEGSATPMLTDALSFAHPIKVPQLGRALHGARLVRSWLERELGCEADAAYGRLRLAPRVRAGWERFQVRGLRLGDAVIRLDHVREKAAHTFHIMQEAGRLPLNLVFAPWLPVSRILAVEIGGAAADAKLSTDTGGMRIECQFPLDPSRELRVLVD